MKSIQYLDSIIECGEITRSSFGKLLKSEQYCQSKKVIITDENVFELWLSFFISSFDELADAEIIQIPAGEENKEIDICTHVWGALSDYEIKRNDLIINIGGGVITDMGGFIASTFKRGIDFINIPTTLLSQVDASIGGKTGVNLGANKNQIGLFSDPKAVFIDSNFLSTLPSTELLSGYAEMLKHGLIADKAYWDLLKNIDLAKPAKMEELIYTSVLIKKALVEKDPTEQGLRKVLNFGHTIGHALEGLLLKADKHIPHGICIAWGMIAEAYLSKKQSTLSADEFLEINNIIRSTFPLIEIKKEEISELILSMQNDKKNTTSAINFTLLSRIGNAIYDQTVSIEAIVASLNFILHHED